MNQLSVSIPGVIVTYNYLYQDMPLDWKKKISYSCASRTERRLTWAGILRVIQTVNSR